MSDSDGIPLVPLTDLAEVNPSRMRITLNSTDEVSFIPMGDVSESGRWTGRQTRTLAEVRNGFTCFADGDVLFAKITPCMENGKGCLVRGLSNSIGFGSTEFHVLRANNCSDPGYVYQWSIYQDLRKTAKNSMTGSAGQQRVPSDFFEKFKVPAFPKPEQTKIAEILSTVDRAIEQTEALIAKQQRLKTGLMQDLLTRGIDEHGRIRSEETHEFKDSPLGRIPVEWEVKALGEIAEVRGGKRLPIGHSYSANDSGYRYLRVTDFFQRQIDYTSLEMLEESTFTALKRYEIKQGDLCVSIAGSLGCFACYNPSTDFKTILTENAARIIPRATLLARLLCGFLNSNFVQAQIEEEKGVGGGVPKLALFRIRSLLVPFPLDHNEQTRILALIDSITDSHSESLTSLAKLLAVKSALMQDLLTGRKCVTQLLVGKEETQ